MTARDLQTVSERIRSHAGYAYIEQRVTLIRREIARETEQEIRAALGTIGGALDATYA